MSNSKSKIENRQFFEIINWRKAQPKMKGGGQSWMKLYTSLLYHEGFAGLDSTNQMEIVALWLYAAVSGHHILPADPKWLMQRIPLLKKPPDLELLANVKDCFGNHNPFIKFVPAPKAKTTARKKKTETETEREREREKDNREKNPTGSRKRERKITERVTPDSADIQKQKEEPEKPENPKESEADSAKVYHLPRPSRSVFNNQGPLHIGSIIDNFLPEHWRDPDAHDFGWEIVEAIGYERNEQNMEIRSEWGQFAKFWTKIKARASPMLLPEIRAKAIEKAKFLNTPKAKSARNKSAVWNKIMWGELSAMGIQIGKVKSG